MVLAPYRGASWRFVTTTAMNAVITATSTEPGSEDGISRVGVGQHGWRRFNSRDRSCLSRLFWGGVLGERRREVGGPATDKATWGH